MKRFLIFLILIALATVFVINCLEFAMGRIVALVLLAAVIVVLIRVNRKK